MNNFFGINASDTSIYDTLLGSGNKSGSDLNSFYSNVNELQMIRSGAYKKALTSFLDSVEGDKEDKKNALLNGSKDSTSSNLSQMKASSQKLNKAAEKLQKINYDTAKAEDIAGDVQNFVTSYNDMLDKVKKQDSYSMLQTGVWATEQMNTSEELLNRVGIKIGADNKLSLDEEEFKKAEKNDLKALFSGSASLAAQIGQKASSLENQSANQLMADSGNSLYTMQGLLG